MKKILFATGNDRKIAEATAALEQYGIHVEPHAIAIDEIQHHDAVEIARAKARAAYEVVQQPVVVSDTCWEIPALGGFPGGYMKDVSTWFTAEDWLSLMRRHEDRTIYCYEHIAYSDGEAAEHFVAKYKGKFIDEIRGRQDDSESVEQVVILYGDSTMAEQLARGELASAGETLDHWMQFAIWFRSQHTP